MNKQTIKDINIKGKKVIVRVDFNVPLDEKLKITDDIRIQAAIPTIKYLLDQKASKVILMSHLGRPKGAEDSLRLNPVAERLSKLLKEPVLKLDDCVGDAIKKAIDKSKERVVLLENLRFHKEEEANDAAFAKQLASLAEVYVNDAFGTAHRAHASTEGITKYLPSVAGFLLQKELEYLGGVINDPEKPYTVILGGKKVSDKILLVENLMQKADYLLIGGGMAYTFLKAQGKKIGKSICQEDFVAKAKSLLAEAKKRGCHIELSQDYVVVQDFEKPKAAKIVAGDIPDGWEGLDIGPKSREAFKKILAKSKTIVWNGPVGVFEVDAYAQGTKELAEYLAKLKAKVIVGGGDSASAAKKFGVDDKMTHISTGGGASLEFLEGKTLPGVAALKNRETAGVK